MIYIYCQANRATGGTELLHQLGYKLILMGYEACMVYYGANEGALPVCEQYYKYDVPFKNSIEDKPDNIVIIPEIAVGFIMSVKNAKRVLWWLSVDNAPLSENAVNIIKADNQLIHCCQSYYAMDFCKKHFFDADEKNPERLFYLSDYINSVFLIPKHGLKRENIVLYNPVKGYEKTSMIIEASDDKIVWFPLKGLSPEEMRNVMNIAKVYIDFGNHPGKDRIPREAALNGCLIVTNKKGAAAFKEDVFIDDNYKFDDLISEKQIADKIYEMVENYDSYKTDYFGYIKRIKDEFACFEIDLFKFVQSLLGLTLDEYREKSDKDLLIKQVTDFVGAGNFKDAFRLLILYKALGYEQDDVYDILEATVRIENKEYAEAYYCIEKSLEKYPENYELYLCMIQACIGIDRFDCVEDMMEKAIVYSEGTEDEETVREIVDCYRNFG